MIVCDNSTLPRMVRVKVKFLISLSSSNFAILIRWVQGCKYLSLSFSLSLNIGVANLALIVVGLTGDRVRLAGGDAITFGTVCLGFPSSIVPKGGGGAARLLVAPPDGVEVVGVAVAVEGGAVVTVGGGTARPGVVVPLVGVGVLPRPTGGGPGGGGVRAAPGLVPVPDLRLCVWGPGGGFAPLFAPAAFAFLSLSAVPLESITD